MQPSPEALGSIDIFSGLDRASRAAIAAKCSAQTYSANTDVIQYGDLSRDVYFLLSGRLTATLYSASGREVAFRDLHPGATFGDLAAIDGTRRSASVIVLEESTVIAMTAEDFQWTYKNFPEVADALLRQLAGLVRALSERVTEFIILTVANRVHLELIRIGRDAAQDAEGNIVITDPPTHEAIAKRVGTQREAVTKELSKLRKQGIIETRSSKQWRIIDFLALQALVAPHEIDGV